MKMQVPFDTYPVNAALDPTGGFAMKLKNLQIVNDDSVFEEVVKEKTLPMSPELLEFGFRCVLLTMADRVSKDCRPRKVGNFLKASPYLRGKLKSAFSAYDRNSCSCAIVFTSLSGLEKNVNTDKYIQFVNTKTGTKVIIDRIVYEGCVDSSQIATLMRGKGIAVTGLNCQWLEGDTCTLVWTDAEGVEQTANIEPLSSTVTEMHFAWPEALDAAPAGPVQMKFLTRGGIADAEPQANDKTVTLIEGIPVPRVDSVVADGSDGVVRGLPFAANGENLGFNFATDHASVEWVDPDGTPRQAAMVPLTATAEKISFSSNPLFDDLPVGTALTFVFTLGGTEVTKESEIVIPPAPTMTVNGATSCSTPWTIHGASTTGMFHMTGENIIFTDSEDEGVWFTYEDDDGETVVKHAGPDKVHQSTTPGAAPYVFDRDFVGGDGSPDKKYTGTLKIASRAGVPGSALQVFEHSCAWDVD